jgi:hypothetical protein
MKERIFGTGSKIISLNRLGSVVWALKINRTSLISFRAMEGDFPAALNEFFAHVAVALATLGAQDIQTQETLQIAKLTHGLFENLEVPIQRLAESMHLYRRTFVERYEQTSDLLHIFRGRMPPPHSEIIASQIREF